MAAKPLPLSSVQVENRILVIRGQKVILDADLATLYAVTTKRLNEQVKRNQQRFPSDFMFQLSSIEKQQVVAKCDHLANLKYSSNNPYAFTEHGAISINYSQRAPTQTIRIGIIPSPFREKVSQRDG